MSLATDDSPYPVLLPASKIIKYSKLPDWREARQADELHVYSTETLRRLFKA